MAPGVSKHRTIAKQTETQNPIAGLGLSRSTISRNAITTIFSQTKERPHGSLWRIVRTVELPDQSEMYCLPMAYLSILVRQKTGPLTPNAVQALFSKSALEIGIPAKSGSRGISGLPIDLDSLIQNMTYRYSGTLKSYTHFILLFVKTVTNGTPQSHAISVERISIPGHEARFAIEDVVYSKNESDGKGTGIQIRLELDSVQALRQFFCDYGKFATNSISMDQFKLVPIRVPKIKQKASLTSVVRAVFRRALSRG